jgi:very-short-patch-repair endonuclease
MSAELVPGISRPPRQCESPIEAMLARAVAIEIERSSIGCEQRLQEKVGPYRADIFIQTARGRTLAIECDGAKFHAATKEQVDRDKRRDRYFASHGISVMRFSGSEIARCPEACATEIRLWLEGSRTPLSVDDELHEISDPSARKSAIMSMWETGRINRAEAEELVSDFGLDAA